MPTAGRNTQWWLAAGRWSAEGTGLLFLWLQSRGERENHPNTCGNLLLYLILLQRPFFFFFFYITLQLHVCYKRSRWRDPTEKFQRGSIKSTLETRLTCTQRVSRGRASNASVIKFCRGQDIFRSFSESVVWTRGQHFSPSLWPHFRWNSLFNQYLKKILFDLRRRQDSTCSGW